MGIEAVCAVAHGPLRGDYPATGVEDTAFRPKRIHRQSNWPDIVDLGTVEYPPRAGSVEWTAQPITESSKVAMTPP